MAAYINRPTWHQTFLEILESLANRSKCLKYQTSALVVKGSQIISMGYNGTFTKAIECCDYWRTIYDKEVIAVEKSTVENDVDQTTTKIKDTPATLTPNALTPNALKSTKTKNTSITFAEWFNTPDIRLRHREWSAANENHAEVNALSWIAKRDVTDEYCLYTLYSPCDACAKEIISYGIKTVYYKYLYNNGVKALERLKEKNILCVKI